VFVVMFLLFIAFGTILVRL